MGHHRSIEPVSVVGPALIRRICVFERGLRQDTFRLSVPPTTDFGCLDGVGAAFGVWHCSSCGQGLAARGEFRIEALGARRWMTDQ